MSDYRETAVCFKALADETRLQIIDMLSGSERCACHLLEAFLITQPTLSYHMKVLTDSGLVSGRKVGTWMHYTLNEDTFAALKQFLDQARTPISNCLCQETCQEACQ